MVRICRQGDPENQASGLEGELIRRNEPRQSPAATRARTFGVGCPKVIGSEDFRVRILSRCLPVHSQPLQEHVHPLERVPLPQGAVFRIRNLVEIGHSHRTPLINGSEGIADLLQAFLN